VTQAEGMVVVAAVDATCVGEDAGELAGIEPLGVKVAPDLEEAIKVSGPQVVVDFTTPHMVCDNVVTCLRNRVAVVVGTTGLSSDQQAEIGRAALSNDTPVFIAPNFAIGAVLMMLFAREAGKHFDYADVIEMHHERKLDAPSGTAARTAQMIAEGRGQAMRSPDSEKTKITLVGVRGGVSGGIHVHSVRMPGFVASQEVIFGGLGQTLTLRHDSISRESFMPGVVLAIRKVRELTGLTVGLEKIL
jgi:4-hydroxy-tetrahydrodipicolinate reductase